jgi:katanin p60 ATPase-containing subunit A1
LDLSASLKESLDAVLQRARGHEARGESSEAGSCYRKAAGLMRQYAQATVSPKMRAERLGKAKLYDGLASKLASGHYVKVSDAAHTGKAGEDVLSSGEDRYEEAITALIETTACSWDDIGGLEETKQTIKTAYVLAVAQAPAGVKLSGWKNILLYGPPGTGKTLLAAATSAQLEATFFNASVSALLSKYFGESSRLIAALYTTARRRSPAVIFLDELDALTPKRGHGEDGAERRILSTLLAELDGLTGKAGDAYVLTMGATNTPWDMDAAILSRFEKKIYVPLPDLGAREAILRIHLQGKGYASEVSYRELAERTEGFSGRELERVCKEIVGQMIQRMNPNLAEVARGGLAAVKSYQVKVCPLTRRDFDVILQDYRPETAPEALQRFADWQRSYV